MSNYPPEVDHPLIKCRFCFHEDEPDLDHVEGALREVDIKLRCSKCYRDDCLSVAFWRSGEPTTVCNECGRDDEATRLEIEEAS